jgi:NADH:ubiquinone oxidoreductase subunit 3 (subunit A)
MPRLRSQAGQVASEYLGVLLLVAVVVAALLATQLHTQIAVEVERAICKIASSWECGEPGVPDDERRRRR